MPWLQQRLQEPSSLAGIGAIVVALGPMLFPQVPSFIWPTIGSLFGAGAVVVPEGGAKK